MPPDRTAYDEKLETILRTAAAVFAEKGFHQASIRDISRASGVSLSGLYYYFHSKDELLFQIQDHALGTLLSRLEELLDGVADPRQRLRLLIDNHVRFFVHNMAEMKVLAHERDSLTGEYQARLHSQKRRLTDVAARILEEIRPDGGLDLRVSTFALFGMMNWLYMWYRPNGDVPVERLVDNLTRLFLDGFLGTGSEFPEGVSRADAAQRTPSVWSQAAGRPSYV